MNIKIVVVTVKGKFEHEIDKNYISIGRGKDNDIIIDDLSVSRKHAILERDETGKLFITDLNSSNGTFINNVRIKEKTPITVNDHILLGKATMVIEMPEDIQGTVRIDASQLQEKIKQEAQETMKSQSVPVPPVAPQPKTQPIPPQTPPPVEQPPVPPQNYQPAPPPVYSQPAPPHQASKSGKIVYGSIMKRFFALLIDGFILTIALLIITGILSFIFFRILPYGIATVLTVLLNISAIVAAFGYYVVGYSKYGTTIGKKLLGLYVVDQKTLSKPTFKQALIRVLVQGFLSGILLIGYIMAFFNPEHKTLHDMLANTYVVQK